MSPVLATSLLIVLGSQPGHKAAPPVPESKIGNDTGSVTGRFVLDGEPAPRQPGVRRAPADPGCLPQRILPLADSRTGGVPHVVVYLRSVVSLSQNSRDSLRQPDTPVQIRFDRCRFEPRMAVVRTGQTLTVRQADDRVHSILPLTIRNHQTGAILNLSRREGADRVVDFSFPLTEPVPIPIRCAVHPAEKAWWVVLDHPFHDITRTTGRFTIHNLPPGQHEFVSWHEACGYVEKRMPVMIRASQLTDLGEITVPVSRLIQN